MHEGNTPCDESCNYSNWRVHTNGLVAGTSPRNSSHEAFWGTSRTDLSQKFKPVWIDGTSRRDQILVPATRLCGKIWLHRAMRLVPAQEVPFPVQYISFAPAFLSHFISIDPLNWNYLLQVSWTCPKNSKQFEFMELVAGTKLKSLKKWLHSTMGLVPATFCKD